MEEDRRGREEATLVDKSRVGRIFQIKNGLKRYLDGSKRVIQTFGRPMEGAVQCTDRQEIKEALAQDRSRDVVVASPSTVEVDEEFVGWLRFFTYGGHDVYIYSLGNQKKEWYVDRTIV